MNIESTNKPDNLKRIESEQIRYLFKNALPSIPFNILCGFVLVLFFWARTDHLVLILWFLLILVVSLARIIHARLTLNSDVLDHALVRSTRLFAMGVLATGIIWSIGYISIGAHDEGAYRLFNILIIAGLASGAFTSMGTHRTCYFLFITPMLATVAITSFLQGTSVGLVTSLIIFIYLTMMTVTHQLIYNMTIESIKLKFENEGLVSDLTSSNTKLEDTNHQLKEAQDYLLLISQTDDLTNLTNRRGFNLEADKEWRRSRRRKQTLACFMIDIDLFKNYNDHYGHPQGDTCLKKVAAAIKSEVNRPDDIVARYGGEEFIVILPDTLLEDAKIMAQRILEAVTTEKIKHCESPLGIVSISIGLATLKPSDKHTLDDLVSAADLALYRAKENGRNQASV